VSSPSQTVASQQRRRLASRVALAASILLTLVGLILPLKSYDMDFTTITVAAVRTPLILALELTTSTWFMVLAFRGTKRSQGALVMCALTLIAVVLDAHSGPSGTAVRQGQGLAVLVAALALGACGVLLTPNAM